MKNEPTNNDPRTASIPAWTCPKCGATHPITVASCCGPAPTWTCGQPLPESNPQVTIKNNTLYG
jgi:hypothetical protein